MKKSDDRLQFDVMQELAWDPTVDHAAVGVAVAGGVVTLSGHVSSYAQKLAAERAAKRVRGVHAIAERIEVRYADARPSDEEIARRIVDLLAWDISIPANDILVKVEDGWVTLSGPVTWNSQAESAVELAGRVGGVLGVVNGLNVRNAPVAHDVRDRIKAALERSADIDAGRIDVRAEGDTIILSGKAHDWHERQTAERAAWAAPGVRNVVDEIVIAA